MTGFFLRTVACAALSTWMIGTSALVVSAQTGADVKPRQSSFNTGTGATETAALTPGVPQPSWGATRPTSVQSALPSAISPEDADLYREIFAVQAAGKWSNATCIQRLTGRNTAS